MARLSLVMLSTAEASGQRPGMCLIRSKISPLRLPSAGSDRNDNIGLGVLRKGE